jgi:hypothetical protein
MDKLFQALKEKSGKIGVVVAVLTLLWSSISAYVGSNTHLIDIQAQQEKRISDLEAQVRNDLATRREIEELRSENTARFDRVENKLDRELEFHHAKKP